MISNITKKKSELADLIKNLGIIIIKDVTLSSGEKSNYYYIKLVVLDPKGCNLVAELLIELISDFDVKSIGGLELGAIPITTTIAMKSYGHPTTKNLKGFIVRKSAKKNGLEKRN